MLKQNLLRKCVFMLVCVCSLAGLAQQDKLVAWEFDAGNNQVPGTKVMPATTGTGSLTFVSSQSFTVEPDDKIYGNVKFKAPANDKLADADWTDGTKHDNYMQFAFSMEGYQNASLAIQLGSDTGSEWRIVFSADEGASWKDCGSFTTSKAWHQAEEFSDIQIGLKNKKNVWVRVLNVKNGNGYNNGYDVRFKSLVVNAEPYVNTNPSFGDEAVTATWAMDKGNECPSAAEVSLDKAFSITTYSYGNNWSGVKTQNFQGDTESPVMTTFNAVKATGNVAFQEENTVEYLLKPSKGLTFLPTHVYFSAGRFGTSGGNMYVRLLVDGEPYGLIENAEMNRSKVTPRVNPTHFSFDLTDVPAASSEVKLVLSVTNLNASKAFGICNVIVSGKVNGTIETVPRYTFATAVSPEGAGSIKQSPVGGEFDEGTLIQLSQSPNFGYRFIKWMDEEGKTLGLDSNLQVEVKKNTTATAVYEAVNVYSLTVGVEGGANDYMVTLSPEPTEIDGKKMYEEGTVVTLEALSNPIVSFNNWNSGETTSELQVTMNQDTELTAVFAAADYVSGWDFYKKGGDGRAADFAAADNDAVTLVLRDAEGNNYSWLDKSQMGAGGYEGRPAAVNWTTVGLGKTYWQTKVNASAFTDLKVIGAMTFNFNAYSVYNVEYSLDGKKWTKIGTFEIPGPKTWVDNEFAVPAEANNKPTVYFRWIADTTSAIGGTQSSNDGIALGGVYIIGIAQLLDDGTAPVLLSSVPEEGTKTASANGKIVLTFDEKVQVAENAVATLNGEQLYPSVTGKSVAFEYRGLEYATDYTFILPGNSISDLTDNMIAQDIELNFTTKERPVVVKGTFDFIVPDDGDLKTALAQAAKRADTSVRYRIFVRQGNYVLPADENSTVEGSDGKKYPNPTVRLNTPNVSIIGEDWANTIITNTVPDVTSGVNPIEGLGKCAVLAFDKEAVETYMQGITLKSGLKDATGRGAALEDGGNKTICKDVCLYGYQDTYLSNNNSGRFYFEGGRLRGRTDFLCGKGDVFYNGVELMMCEAGGYLAVPSNPKKYGYIFRDCVIRGEVDGINGNYTLGRPWGQGTPIALYINTTMEIQPSAVGWNEMSGGWPARFAEYNSLTSNGTAIDLSGRKTVFGDGHVNNPVLSEEEAETYTVATVMGAEDDWNPTDVTEQASVPENVKLDGEMISWSNNNYVLCWAVCKDGKVIGFTTEPTYVIDDVTAVYTVRAVNEMGGLGEPAKAEGAIGIEEISASPMVVRSIYYNMQGMQVPESTTGSLIRVDVLENGQQIVTKMIR